MTINQISLALHGKSVDHEWLGNPIRAFLFGLLADFTDFIGGK